VRKTGLRLCGAIADESTGFLLPCDDILLTSASDWPGSKTERCESEGSAGGTVGRAYIRGSVVLEEVHRLEGLIVAIEYL